jgi:hypothetical protein
MVDGTTLIGYIGAGVIMTGVIVTGINPMRVMSVHVIDSTGCSQIIRNVALSLDIVLEVGCQQRHNGGKLGHQKETQEPGGKPPQSA